MYRLWKENANTAKQLSSAPKAEKRLNSRYILMSLVIVAICTCLRTTRRQMIFRKLHIPASAQQKGQPD
ncbi:hypothetical protein T05_5071 [Trichinella murrelli]|uniref:Uncharacterized protein n=1 Tax=Trichinella murrelli TaxID=144512 RepID=A0A0V0TQ37_9BILA|nr:hypothetical protein T05_5071 [Trichinella murrelli]